ncbi:MAG: hypothetical protein JO279_00345 [Verrucomicrobia bacterium]|nr:hypothetical protein [Verrucomicrobiota bacterium]MBV8375430.1 hypothetical protein [Verrucomicrobiota bacterium]
MMATAIQSGTPKPRSAIWLAIFILALFGVEIYWIYGWHRSNEELYLTNIRRGSQNALDLRKIVDLRAAAVRINGLYLRLHDPSASPSPNAQQLPPLVSGIRQNAPEPMVIQDFLKAGFSKMPSAAMRPEASIGYELRSNQLEFHRLVPLIAQEENSNAFLFLDHLEFIRPKTTEPFSPRPTALQARLTARMFTSATR